MSPKRKPYYYVDILGLSDKTHEFEFDITSDFFELFEYDDIQSGNLICQMELIKSAAMIKCNCSIKGDVGLTCDRSLDNFEKPINISKSVMFKYGESFKELNEDLFVIATNEDRLIFDQVFFDWIILEVPMKKLHPRFAQDDDEEEELIYSSEAEDEKVEENNDICDPRWESLKKFKQEKD